MEAGHTFLLVMLRRSSAWLLSSPWPASSRSSSTRLSRSSCWNSKSSNSFVSVSRASASLNDSDREGQVVLRIGSGPGRPGHRGGSSEGWPQGNRGRDLPPPTQPPFLCLALPLARGLSAWSSRKERSTPPILPCPLQATAPTLVSGRYCRAQVVPSHRSPLFWVGGPRGPGKGGW